MQDIKFSDEFRQYLDDFNLSLLEDELEYSGNQNGIDSDVFSDHSSEEEPSILPTLPGTLDEIVDLFCMPSRVVLPDFTCVTIGDGHGNLMKTIFILVKFGIITNMNENWYNRLYQIFQIPIDDLKKEEFFEFLNILDQLTFNNKLFFRSLGDDVADRMGLDYYTFYLYSIMKRKGVYFEILASNHGQEVVTVTELQTIKGINSIPFCAQDLPGTPYVDSMENLERIIDKGFVTRCEIHELINTAYKPHLKVASCAVHEKNIFLFTHAPYGIYDISRLAKHLSVKLELWDEDPNPLEIFNDINKINVKFSEYLADNKVCSLYKKSDFHEDSLLSSPYLRVLWNRCYSKLYRPAIIKGFNIHFVHGHDENQSIKAQHIIQMDNTLGKSKNEDSGRLRVFMCLEKNLALINQMTCSEMPQDHQSLGSSPLFNESLTKDFDKNSCHEELTFLRQGSISMISTNIKTLFKHSSEHLSKSISPKNPTFHI